FEYAENWLAHPYRFSLEPTLALGPGPFYTAPDKAMFGALGDSAPDRWGRMLMRRAERRRSTKAGETPRALREIDYLLNVDDEARQGALRFARRKGGPYLAERGPTRIPPLVDLPKLLSATEHLIDQNESDEDLRLLLAPGSSLGGARPKASVRDRDSRLAIAKFPHKNDDINTIPWEALALKLAAMAGITVSSWRIENISNKTVLLLRRFDRSPGGNRIPFISAMSMLDARDNETRSYLELADALQRYGAAPKKDMRELWRRIVFNILISNTDDHLRNHGFLCEGPEGWRLSPAYDLNPVPADVKPRILSTAIDLDDGAASLDLAMEVAAYFRLDKDSALGIIKEVGTAVSTWRRQAASLGLKAPEIDRMASAFEHKDLEFAHKTGPQR
ncbi:MAG: HipA domain-containing protein, partial [Desulfobacterales bacterium]|nr:HipA domain-containing protein [Desulfobacterales bacterium]